MPSKGRIQSKDFVELLIELGVNQNGIPFDLRSEVTPVVLVGGTVSFVAAPTPPYRIQDIFTEGVQTAPPAGTTLADTGPLPVGAYSVVFLTSAGEAAHMRLFWRDVADGVTLWQKEIVTPGIAAERFEIRLQIENAGERFRITNIIVGSATIQYDGTIMART